MRSLKETDGSGPILLALLHEQDRPGLDHEFEHTSGRNMASYFLACLHRRWLYWSIIVSGFNTFSGHLSAFQVPVYHYYSLVANYRLFAVFLQTSSLSKENSISFCSSSFTLLGCKWPRLSIDKANRSIERRIEYPRDP